MSDEEAFTIKVSMQSRWVPHFLGMLDFMQHAGAIGMSRTVRLFADGDGDFRPRFEWDIDAETALPASGGPDEPFWDAG